MATNDIGNYNEVQFAQEALLAVEKRLGLASRLYREYETDTKEVGDTTNIRRPSTFVSQAAPSNAQDINTGKVALTLDQHDEVKIELTDKLRALSNDKLISDHLRPMAYALADGIDQKLVNLIKRVPWFYQLGSTFSMQELANARKVLFDNQVPMDRDNLFGMTDGGLEANMLGYLSGQNIQGANVDEARRYGALGPLMGVNWFANQNTPTLATNTMTDVSGTLGANASKGATTISIAGIDTTGALVDGDTFSIAGLTQRFVVTAPATATGGAIASLSIFPALPAAVTSGTIVTFHKLAAAKATSLVFHRNFAALKFAPLPDDMPGVQVSTIRNEDLGLAVRARIFYEGNNSKLFVAFDCLYGYTMLDPNLATRVYAN
ncbi:P22 phage major capsid protein family protein [Gemmatimonas sp.]